MRDALEKIRIKLSDGAYHTKFDAMSVASLELEEIKTIDDITKVNISGLQQLICDITHVLNSGVVDQQAVLALAKEECEMWTHVAEGVRHEHHTHSAAHEEGSVSWDTLPDAVTHDAPKILLPVAGLVQSDLHSQLQKINDDLHELLEAKLCAFEFIESLLATYAGNGLDCMGQYSFSPSNPPPCRTPRGAGLLFQPAPLTGEGPAGRGAACSGPPLAPLLDHNRGIRRCGVILIALPSPGSL